MSSPRAYLILGSSGSGRRAIAADLIENGLGADARPLLLVAEGETALPDAVAQRLGDVKRLTCAAWKLEDGRMIVPFDEEVTDVFVVANGGADPVDQIEAFHDWLAASGCALARIITVVDCTLGHAHPELQRWFDACVHFSDVVLLNRRPGVPQTWISAFTGRLRKEHFPCLVELVKHDEVENPALVLEPQARRMSTYFDDPAEWPEIDDDEEDEADDDAIAAVDPYIERLAGSGRRAKEIPDIRKVLAGG